MTFISLILMAIGKKINLSDRIIIKESLNQDNFSGMVSLIKSISKYTLIFELLGAMFLSIRFIPQYGTRKGIFYSIFHAISAFCNAGFDILGSDNLARYGSDVLINVTVMLLIIIGGLGFTVWNDIFKSITKVIKLASALFSMLFLETAMFAQFGAETPLETKRIMIMLTGAGISITVVAMAIYMIVKTSKEIKQYKNNKEWW